MRDTIYALATAPGRGGVAVVRISGPQALQTGLTLSRRETLPPRTAVFSPLYDPRDNSLIDKALLLYFAAPASFTGEDVLEFHIHGGQAVSTALQQALGTLPGLRLAEPGEFTKRAFENEKLDLTEAEAIADLVDAQTQAQRIQALDQLSGSLSRLYNGWADHLKKLLAHQEADLEFPEEDLPSALGTQTRNEIEKLKNEIESHLHDGRRGEILRDGLSIAILGAPNAGKSSLLNALAQRDAAIVSDIAGTTRDIIDVRLDLNGYPVIVSDTAGLRVSDDQIETEGVRRARARAQDAHIKLILFDAIKLQDQSSLDLIDDQSLIVYTKTDLAPAPAGAQGISLHTGEGLEDLIKTLTQRVAEKIGHQETPSLTRARHREALEQTQDHLRRSLQATLPELAAEDLRLALRALGKITGRVHVEDLLDVIFRDFCIGK